MFDSPADAAQALQAYFDRPRIEIVVEALVPAMVFEPLPDGRIAIGVTRLGGVPDLPAGVTWPRPAAPDNPEGIAGRGNEEAAKEMREHLARGLPYAFIGQVDLAEASALGSTASVLPSEGRLLFFYDLAVGPWETGMRPARVIWDQSPREALTPAETPRDLAEAQARYHKDMDEIRATFGEKNKKGKEEGTIYGAPARAVRLKPTLRLPHTHALEMEALPELNALLRGQASGERAEAFREAYDEALMNHHDYVPKEAWRRQQLLGSPQPEQDDPRYDAVVVSQFGKQHLSSGEWKTHRTEIVAQARDWLLLLQIGLSDWMQAEFTEGSVYFLIRRSDLEQRRFDQVVAVYQQT